MQFGGTVEDVQCRAGLVSGLYAARSLRHRRRVWRRYGNTVVATVFRDNQTKMGRRRHLRQPNQRRFLGTAPDRHRASESLDVGRNERLFGLARTGRRGLWYAGTDFGVAIAATTATPGRTRVCSSRDPVGARLSGGRFSRWTRPASSAATTAARPGAS